MAPSSVNDIFTYVSYDNRYTRDMLSGKRPISLNDCRPMKLEEKKEEEKNVETVVISETQESSAILKEPKSFDIKKVEKKAYPLAIGITRKLDEEKVAKMGIFSGASILAGLNVPQFSNLDFVFSIFGEISDNRSKIKIPPKVIGVSGLAITRTQASFIGILFILILPAFVVIFGIFVYYRRRRR